MWRPSLWATSSARAWASMRRPHAPCPLRQVRSLEIRLLSWSMYYGISCRAIVTDMPPLPLCNLGCSCCCKRVLKQNGAAATPCARGSEGCMMSYKVDSSIVYLCSDMKWHDDHAGRPLNTLEICMQACRAQPWGSCWHRRTFQTLSWRCPQQYLWCSWPWGALGWPCSGVTGPQWIPERC